jgi:hypothetical protein
MTNNIILFIVFIGTTLFGYSQSSLKNKTIGKTNNIEIDTLCISGKRSNIADISIDFPIISKLNPDINSRIKAELLQVYCADLEEDKKYNLTENSLFELFKQYYFIPDPDPDAEADALQTYLIPETVEIKFGTVYNENNILTLSVRKRSMQLRVLWDEYFVEFINIDLRSGQRLKLENILVSNYQSSLTNIAKQELENKYGSDNYFSGFNVEFSLLCENFAISKEGLQIDFGNMFSNCDNQLPPSTTDKPDITIPWSRIKHLIKPTGPLAFILK